MISVSLWVKKLKKLQMKWGASESKIYSIYDYLQMPSDNNYLENRRWKITFFPVSVFLGQNISVLISDIKMKKKNQLATFYTEKYPGKVPESY